MAPFLHGFLSAQLIGLTPIDQRSWTSSNGRSAVLFKNACLVERNVDRSGAASEEVHQNLINLLIETHPEITAKHIFYRTWADHILLRLPVGEREDAIRDLLPKEIIHFFSASPSELSTRAQAAKDSMLIWLGMLAVMETQLNDMKQSLAAVLKAGTASSVTARCHVCAIVWKWRKQAKCCHDRA